MTKFAKVALPAVATAALLILVTPSLALALPPVPEIDPSSGTTAIALVAGAILILRGRRWKA
jgi:hypothetical protein